MRKASSRVGLHLTDSAWLAHLLAGLRGRPIGQPTRGYRTGSKQQEDRNSSLSQGARNGKSTRGEHGKLFEAAFSGNEFRQRILAEFAFANVWSKLELARVRDLSVAYSMFDECLWDLLGTISNEDRKHGRTVSVKECLEERFAKCSAS